MKNIPGLSILHKYGNIEAKSNNKRGNMFYPSSKNIEDEWPSVKTSILNDIDLISGGNNPNTYQVGDLLYCRDNNIYVIMKKDSNIVTTNMLDNILLDYYGTYSNTYSERLNQHSRFIIDDSDKLLFISNSFNVFDLNGFQTNSVLHFWNNFCAWSSNYNGTESSNAIGLIFDKTSNKYKFGSNDYYSQTISQKRETILDLNVNDVLVGIDNKDENESVVCIDNIGNLAILENISYVSSLTILDTDHRVYVDWFNNGLVETLDASLELTFSNISNNILSDEYEWMVEMFVDTSTMTDIPILNEHKFSIHIDEITKKADVKLEGLILNATYIVNVYCLYKGIKVFKGAQTTVSTSGVTELGFQLYSLLPIGTEFDGTSVINNISSSGGTYDIWFKIPNTDNYNNKIQQLDEYWYNNISVYTTDDYYKILPNELYLEPYVITIDDELYIRICGDFSCRKYITGDVDDNETETKVVNFYLRNNNFIKLQQEGAISSYTYTQEQGNIESIMYIDSVSSTVIPWAQNARNDDYDSYVKCNFIIQLEKLIEYDTNLYNIEFEISWNESEPILEDKTLWVYDLLNNTVSINCYVQNNTRTYGLEDEVLNGSEIIGRLSTYIYYTNDTKQTVVKQIINEYNQSKFERVTKFYPVYSKLAPRDSNVPEKSQITTFVIEDNIFIQAEDLTNETNLFWFETFNYDYKYSYATDLSTYLNISKTNNNVFTPLLLKGGVFSTDIDNEIITSGQYAVKSLVESTSANSNFINKSYKRTTIIKVMLYATVNDLYNLFVYKNNLGTLPDVNDFNTATSLTDITDYTKGLLSIVSSDKPANMVQTLSAFIQNDSVPTYNEQYPQQSRRAEYVIDITSEKEYNLVRYNNMISQIESWKTYINNNDFSSLFNDLFNPAAYNNYNTTDFNNGVIKGNLYYINPLDKLNTKISTWYQTNPIAINQNWAEIVTIEEGKYYIRFDILFTVPFTFINIVDPITTFKIYGDFKGVTYETVGGAPSAIETTIDVEFDPYMFDDIVVFESCVYDSPDPYYGSSRYNPNLYMRDYASEKVFWDTNIISTDNYVSNLDNPTLVQTFNVYFKISSKQPLTFYRLDLDIDGKLNSSGTTGWTYNDILQINETHYNYLNTNWETSKLLITSNEEQSNNISFVNSEDVSWKVCNLSPDGRTLYIMLSYNNTQFNNVGVLYKHNSLWSNIDNTKPIITLTTTNTITNFSGVVESNTKWKSGSNIIPVRLNLGEWQLQYNWNGLYDSTILTNLYYGIGSGYAIPSSGDVSSLTTSIIWVILPYKGYEYGKLYVSIDGRGKFIDSEDIIYSDAPIFYFSNTNRTYLNSSRQYRAYGIKESDLNGLIDSTIFQRDLICYISVDDNITYHERNYGMGVGKIRLIQLSSSSRIGILEYSDKSEYDTTTGSVSIKFKTSVYYNNGYNYDTINILSYMDQITTANNNIWVVNSLTRAGDTVTVSLSLSTTTKGLYNIIIPFPSSVTVDRVPESLNMVVNYRTDVPNISASCTSFSVSSANTYIDTTTSKTIKHVQLTNPYITVNGVRTNNYKLKIEFKGLTNVNNVSPHILIGNDDKGFITKNIYGYSVNGCDKCNTTSTLPIKPIQPFIVPQSEYIYNSYCGLIAGDYVLSNNIIKKLSIVDGVYKTAFVKPTIHRTSNKFSLISNSSSTSLSEWNGNINDDVFYKYQTTFDWLNSSNINDSNIGEYYKSVTNNNAGFDITYIEPSRVYSSSTSQTMSEFLYTVYNDYRYNNDADFVSDDKTKSNKWIARRINNNWSSNYIDFTGECYINVVINYNNIYYTTPLIVNGANLKITF